MVTTRYIDPVDGGDILGSGLGITGPAGARRIAVVAPTAIKQVHVSATGDDDLNTGTAASPYKTIARAAKDLQHAAGVINVPAGTFQLPLLRGMPFPVVINGAVSEQFAASAGIGTTGASIKGTFTAGANEGDIIEMLSGAAAGQRRTIEETTTTDLVPAEDFSPAPTDGDSYRVVSPATFLDGLVAGPWIAGCGTPRAFFSSGIADPLQASGGVYFRNIELTAPSNISLYFQHSAVYFFGCKAGSTVSLYPDRSACMLGVDAGFDASYIESLLGLPSGSEKGCTLFTKRASVSAIYSSAGMIFGYFTGVSGAACRGTNSAYLRIVGGLVRGAPLTLEARCAAELGFTANNNSLRLIQSGGGICLDARSGSFATLFGGTLVTSSGSCISAIEDAAVKVNGACALDGGSGNAIKASQAGHCFIAGSPAAWTGNLRVSATEAQPGSYFSALDVTLVAAVGNGSIITRVS